MTSASHINVGVDAFIVRDGKLLLGKRGEVFGKGSWTLPGGHLEPSEDLTDAVLREIIEETGMIFGTATFANIVNNPRATEHYIQIGFLTHDTLGEPILREPDKCTEWKWFPLDALPTPIFVGHRKQIELFFRAQNATERIDWTYGKQRRN